MGQDWLLGGTHDVNLIDSDFIFSNAYQEILLKQVKSEVSKSILSSDSVIEVSTKDYDSNLNSDNPLRKLSVGYPEMFSQNKPSKKAFGDVVRWKGYVTEIYSDTFKANLEDLDDRTTYEIGEFSKQEIHKDDLDLFKKGAVFYLSAGFFTNPNGTITKRKIFKFQRLIAWTSEEYDRAIDRGNELFKKLTRG